MKAERPIKDIPESVLDEASIGLLNYMVPIIAFSPQDTRGDVRLIGSGTLVEIDSAYYVLTAAHVWHATRHFEQIGFALTSYHSAFAVPRDRISERRLWDPPLDVPRQPLSVGAGSERIGITWDGKRHFRGVAFGSHRSRTAPAPERA